MNKFKDIKIGIIGCGYWATNIIKSLEEENFKNVYVFDFVKKKFSCNKCCPRSPKYFHILIVLIIIFFSFIKNSSSAKWKN